MTNQEFFTKCVTHVLSQTEQSTNDEGWCVYAGENGGACAVGCVLPRHVAEEADEILSECDTSAVDELLKHVPAAAELLSGVDLRLMEKCQIAHDARADDSRDEFAKARLANKFKIIAKEYGLVFPQL